MDSDVASGSSCCSRFAQAESIANTTGKLQVLALIFPSTSIIPASIRFLQFIMESFS